MHNTGNPLPSKDILDLYDNSETIDNFVNSQQDEIPDRFGTKRLTLCGLIKRSMALRNEINDFSGALTFKPEWTDVPMNVSEGVGGEGGALNLQAEALGNRTEINKNISREALRRSLAEAGLTLVNGSFREGGTLNSVTDVLLNEIDSKVYSWGGSFPKVVSAGSTLETSGGVGVGGWKDKSYVLLVEELRLFSGTDLIGYVFSGAMAYKKRTVTDRCKDRISLYDFLIDSDVDNNWSPVLQRALDYIASLPLTERQQLYVPPRREYLFQDSVIWPTTGNVVEGIAIVADYVTNTRATGVTKFTYQGTGIFIDLRKGTEAPTEGGIRICGISFLGLTGSIAINAYNIVSSVFEYVSFGGFEIGFKAPNWCYYCVFEKCNFFGLKQIGCYVGLLNGTTFDRCRFNKIDALGTVNGAGTCIKVVSGGLGGKLVGCWLEDTRIGLAVSLTPQIEMIGCYLEGLIHPIYSADTSGGLSRVVMRNCRQTIWHNNTRVAASINGGQLNVTLAGHRSSGAADLLNISMGLQASGGTIFMDIQDYRIESGTPLQLFGYTPWTPQYSGVYDYYGGCRKAAAGVDVELTSSTRNELMVTDAIVHQASGATLKRDVRAAVLTHGIPSDGLVFSIPYSASESRFITAEVSANIGSGRAQRFWRGVVMMQTQAGSATVRAVLVNEFLSPSLDELSSTRTISGVVASIVISGTNVTLKFTVTSGGSASPFNVTGLFYCSVLNNTTLYPLI